MNIENISYQGFLPKKEFALANIKKLPPGTLPTDVAFSASIREEDEDKIYLYSRQGLYKISVPKKAKKVEYDTHTSELTFKYKKTEYIIATR